MLRKELEARKRIRRKEENRVKKRIRKRKKLENCVKKRIRRRKSKTQFSRLDS